MGEDPSPWDIPGQIRKAIVDFVFWVARTGMRPVLDTLGRTVLSTPDLAGSDRVRTVWTTTLVAANAVFVLFVIAAGLTITTRETLQSQYGAKEMLPRLTVGAVAANVSLILCGKAIEATNALTAAIAGQGVDGHTAATAIIQALDQAGDGNSFLLAVLAVAVLVMAVIVVITFIIRIALLVALIGVAPLALLCHAAPQTEGLAYTWWRAFGACLGIQLGQAIVLVSALRVFLTPAGPTVLGIPASKDGLLGVLVCLTMLWLLVKIPMWMRHLVMGGLARRRGRGIIGQVIHAVLLAKTLSHLLPGSHAPRRGRPPRHAPNPPAARSAAVKPTPSAARAVRPTRPRPRTAVPPRTGRRAVSPGPAAFSNAPITHTPLPRPAGTGSTPEFNHRSPAATPTPTRAGRGAPVRFSHAPSPQPTVTPTTTPPTAPAFSTAPRPATPPRPASVVPPVVFSAPNRPQAAPKRPPAPVAPVFSHPPKPPPTMHRRRQGGDS